MKRITSRDQRAVVMRCTATKVQPADESDVKNSQFAWKAFQTRSGARKSPATNTTTPITRSTSVVVYKRRGSARLVAAIESEEGRRLAESLVKSMTGGTDMLTAPYQTFVWALPVQAVQLLLMLTASRRES